MLIPCLLTKHLRTCRCWLTPCLCRSTPGAPENSPVRDAFCLACSIHSKAQVSGASTKLVKLCCIGTGLLPFFFHPSVIMQDYSRFQLHASGFSLFRQFIRCRFVLCCSRSHPCCPLYMGHEDLTGSCLRRCLPAMQRQPAVV